MDRREFLQCSAILIGGVSAGRMGWTLSAEQRRHLAEAPSCIDRQANYFSAEQGRAVAAVAETILPRTDTPGAVDAGVPRYIELMVAEWFDEGERRIFEDGLKSLMDEAPARHGRPFEQLPERDRVAMLEALEDSAGDASWYAPGANMFADFDGENPFICQIKELTIWGFFTSEVGSTQVLRYNPMPMRFDGDLPLGPEDSSWVGSIF